MNQVYRNIVVVVFSISLAVGTNLVVRHIANQAFEEGVQVGIATEAMPCAETLLETSYKLLQMRKAMTTPTPRADDYE